MSNILNKCHKLKKHKKGITKYLKSEGYTDREIEAIKQQLKNKPARVEEPQHIFVAEDENEALWKRSLKFTDKYVYNKQDDKYIIHLKAANGNIVLSGHTVRTIKENYSNWYGNEHSIAEICRNHRIPRNYFTELKEALGITHDSEPVTIEELRERDIDEIADDIIEKRKFQLYQEVQKRSWKETEQAAEKWFRMQEGVYEPFTSFITNWKPPKYEPIKFIEKPKNKFVHKKLVVGLSDVHFGSKHNRNDSFRKESYSTEEAVRVIDAYAQDVIKLKEARTYHIDECVLVSLGDILHTTGQGFTAKGTMLVHDCVKEEQFNYAFDTLVKFINTLLATFPRVSVKSVKGNHSDFGDYVLFKTLEAYYRAEKRIKFEVFQTDHGLFKLDDCLFLISHGYSAEYRGKIPTATKAREGYIANLFLSRPEELQGVKQKVFLTADQHHLEMREYAEFEHYMLSTAAKGDKYAEALGLRSIARQSCFVVDKDGIKEVVYCYG
jgi:hypothetical protein